MTIFWILYVIVLIVIAVSWAYRFGEHRGRRLERQEWRDAALSHDQEIVRGSTVYIVMSQAEFFTKHVAPVIRLRREGRRP